MRRTSQRSQRLVNRHGRREIGLGLLKLEHLPTLWFKHCSSIELHAREERRNIGLMLMATDTATYFYSLIAQSVSTPSKQSSIYNVCDVSC